MGLALKVLKQLETKISETIFLELPFQIRNGFLFLRIDHRVMQINNYENILLMGHVKISTLTQTNSRNTTNHLINFCDIFALSNLVNVKTCTKSVCGTSLDTMLTNKPRSFYNTS